MHGPQQEGCTPAPVRQCRAVERNALTCIDLSLAIQGQMVGIFGDERMGDRCLCRQAALDQPRRGQHLHHHVRAGATGIFRPAHHQDAELGGHHVEALGHVLADAVQLAGTARADVALDIDHGLDPRQMGGQRAAVRTAPGDPFGLLGRRLLLGRGEADGLDLLGLFQRQQKLILRQGLGPAAEAVSLQLLDDLAQALDLRFPRDQHRLKRLGVTGKLWRERGHDQK